MIFYFMFIGTFLVDSNHKKKLFVWKFPSGMSQTWGLFFSPKMAKVQGDNKKKIYLTISIEGSSERSRQGSHNGSTMTTIRESME